MRRVALLVPLAALLAYPVAANACDRNPGDGAGLSVRTSLAVAHPAKQHHAAKIGRYAGYR